MGKRKFVKRNKGKGNNPGGNRKQPRKNFEETVKENLDYENYYKEQKVIGNDEVFKDFMDHMRMPLPTTFRVTGYKENSKQLIENMKNVYFKTMDNLKIDGELVKPPVQLPWYPDGLGWQTSFSRSQLRGNPGLESFHRYTISETESGYITRQEAVSMIPPLMLDVQSHHKVLDMCAAPGSKTAQIVELIHKDDSKAIPDGICIANDKDNKRCYMLVHQIQRLNSPSSLIVNHDAAHFPELYIKTANGSQEALRYDRILCDVPCSGDGTLRKNPDIWGLWKTQNALNLHNIQLRILLRGLELLADGGRLVYSTCSINPIEDEAVVAAALEKCEGTVELIPAGLPNLKWNKGVCSWKVMDKSMTWYNSYKEVPESATFIKETFFPPANADKMNLDLCMRFLPHQQDTGGFFVAVLHKTKTLPWQKVKKERTQCKQVGSESEDGSNSPPRKTRKWQAGFNEDPFVFFTPKQKPIVDSIKAYYGISDEFPDKQLLTRTTQDKKKRVYFVTDICKNIIENNVNHLKVINTGLRMFCRCDNTHEDVSCDFRLVQDGAESLRPYMKSRVVKVYKADVLTLLVNEQPEYETLSEDFRNRLQSQATGSLILEFVPKDGDGVNCSFFLCAWRGKRAARLYLNRHERIHHLNLLCQPIPEHLKLNKNSHRTRTDNAAAEEKKTEEPAVVEENKSEEDVAAVTVLLNKDESEVEN